MGVKEKYLKNPEVKYKLVPPEGGWGHLITMALIVSNWTICIPMACFGIMFGEFLASVGDETTGTSLTNGIFNTVMSFTGLAASLLFKNYSYRMVGLIGAMFISAGAAATIFVQSLPQLIVFYSLLQGFGFGLMYPAGFSAFNAYFDKKLGLMMGIAQALMVMMIMVYPPSVAALKAYFGFKKLLVIYFVVSLANIPAMALLQPVEKHLKKVPLEEADIEKDDLNKTARTMSKSVDNETAKDQRPLLTKSLEKSNLTATDSVSKSSLTRLRYQGITQKPRASLISIGDRTMSVTTMNLQGDNADEPTTKCMDISLFKSPKYLNIAFGISLSFTSDVIFNSMIPLLLNNAGFSSLEVASMMTMFFASNLSARILLSVISAFFKLRNRYLFLASSFLSAIFRTAFITRNTYMWRLVIMLALGFLRCFIQTPLALVISEEYNENFATAFSLYMVICGGVNLIIGPLISFVKQATKSDDMVIHVLTAAYLICSFSWIFELRFFGLK